MADSPSDSSFIGKHLNGWKEFWGERFSFLEPFSRAVNREDRLRWSESDVEQFIASDPVHGSTLKTVREAANFGYAGSLLGAVSTAGVAWKYSRSLHGTGLSFIAGGVFGFTFGTEVANHWLQLYRLDIPAANCKFLEFVEKKNGAH